MYFQESLLLGWWFLAQAQQPLGDRLMMSLFYASSLERARMRHREEHLHPQHWTRRCTQSTKDVLWIRRITSLLSSSSGNTNISHSDHSWALPVVVSTIICSPSMIQSNIPMWALVFVCLLSFSAKILLYSRSGLFFYIFFRGPLVSCWLHVHDYTF